MKLVIQRVKKAQVTVLEKGEVVGKIDPGLLILVGIGEGDKEEAVDILAQKVAKLRIMADAAGKMNLSVKDAKGEILAVSQFTLYADTSDGNRPSFIKAANPDVAQNLYERFIDNLRKEGIKVETGQFGSYMKIEPELDGPVTIILES